MSKVKELVPEMFETIPPVAEEEKRDEENLRQKVRTIVESQGKKVLNI
jgi:hypothetical protein